MRSVYEVSVVSFVKLIYRQLLSLLRRKDVVALMQRGRLWHVHKEEETFVTGVYLGTWAPWARGMRNMVCIIACVYYCVCRVSSPLEEESAS